MKEFTMIKNEVRQDAEKRISDTAHYILYGYMPSWAAEHQTESDRGLKQHSTATRWEQYTSGKISREKAVELATKRATKEIEKATAEKLAKLDRIAQAPELSYITVAVEWKRSSVWGFNPTATVTTNTEFASGHASGCGYDKESAAIADAFNQCDSILKALYTYKENQLQAGETDESKTAVCGRSNGSIIGYGSGYGAIPYFEGGVGASCFWAILKKCGFITRENHSRKHSDFYSVEKEVA